MVAKVLSINGDRPALSGIGFNDEPESGVLAAPIGPTARWDDEGYDRGDDADAFGAGDMILNGRCGYAFHVSCWILLEKVFHPAIIDCARLYEVCASLPRPGDFFSWGHGYGGLVAHDTVHYFPWNSIASYHYPTVGGSHSTPERAGLPLTDHHDENMSRTTRDSTEGADMAAESYEDDADDDQSRLSALGALPNQPDEKEWESGESADETSQGQSDRGEIDLEPAETLTHADHLSNDSSSQSMYRDTVAGSIEEHRGPMTSEAPLRFEGDQNPDGDEETVAEHDNGVVREQSFVAEAPEEAPRDSLYTGENFIRDNPSMAGVPPRSVRSDSGLDYMLSDYSDHMPSLLLEVPSSDPYDIPDVHRLLADESQSPPVFTTHNTLSTGDTFAALPEEIRTAIARCLLTSDALSLRAASRSFWHIFYSQQFWKSRFTLLHPDRSWLFESLDGNMTRDWRYLYRRTSNLSSSPALQNRKRIWGLAMSIRDILNEQSLENPDDSDSAATGHTEEQDKNVLESIEVAGLVHPRPAPHCFSEGCRITQRQRLSLSDPVKLSRIAFSLVRVGNTTYISGLRFVSSEISQQIGYRSPTEHTLALNSCLTGWRIAVGPRGIQAIQCVFADKEAHSPWFGSLEDACITNRLADSDIKTIDFGLDVSLISLPSYTIRHPKFKLTISPGLQIGEHCGRAAIQE